MAVGKEGNVKWVDGLRGIASLLVVFTHLTRPWNGDLFSSTSAEGAAPRLLQLPYLRILIQGRIGVTIFAFVTGYVCALKPIKLCKQGNQEAALTSISKSALRRFPRLFLPAAAATCVNFIFAELGFFTIAHHQNSFLVAIQSPPQISNVSAALRNLIRNIVGTWTRSTDDYDNNQWTMLPLLKGSFWVYVFLVATVYVEPRFRMWGSFGLWVYFLLASDSAFGMQFFWGTLLADMQSHEPFTALVASRPRISAVISGLFMLIGLTFASFPEANPEWMDWSRTLLNIMTPILPANPDFPRFGSGFGLEFISLAIVFSPQVLQRALSSRVLLFFGRMSFAVYLLHGGLLRTVLVWMLFGVHTLPDHENEEGQMVETRLEFPGNTKLIMWQVVWLPMVYGLAYLWIGYVDPWCDRMTNRLVEFVKLDQGEKAGILPTR